MFVLLLESNSINYCLLILQKNVNNVNKNNTREITICVIISPRVSLAHSLAHPHTCIEFSECKALTVA